MLNGQQLDAATQYVVDRAKFVIESFGPRPPGSEAERKAQEVVRDDLAAVCDEPVWFEEFLVAQKAFFSMQAIGGALNLMGFAAYWLVHPLAALGCSVLSIFILYHQLLRYHLLLDPFFPKKPSYNVTGRQRPRGEIKRRVILNGHPDGAYEWRFNYNFPKLFPLITAFSLIGLFTSLLLALVGSIAAFTAMAWLTPLCGYLMIPFLPGAVIGLLFNDLRYVAPGANDNLTGTFISTGILKYMREAGLQLEHTELMAAVTGSEEAGLRGAKAWAAKHRRDFDDAETIIIAIDTIRDLPHLTIYSRDLNGTVPHDPATCQLLKDAALALGRDVPFGSIPLGSSDGTAFTQAGFRSAALCAMDPHPAHYYHNRRDNWDDMDPECIREVIAILCEAIRRYDADGLPAVKG